MFVFGFGFNLKKKTLRLRYDRKSFDLAHKNNTFVNVFRRIRMTKRALDLRAGVFRYRNIQSRKIGDFKISMFRFIQN